MRSVRDNLRRMFSGSMHQRVLLSFFVSLVVAFHAIGWWSGSTIESASTPVNGCGIGIAPCQTRPPASSSIRAGLSHASSMRYRSIIPLSARGIEITGSRFDRINVTIPASGGSVTASDQSFTLTIPGGIALDPAGNPRNVRLVIEQITPPEDSQMVGFWAARASMTYEDGWLVDPQAHPVDIIVRFRQNDLLRVGAGSASVNVRTRVNGVQWKPAESTIDTSRLEARMSTNLLASFALTLDRAQPGPTVRPPPPVEASTSSPTPTPRPNRSLSPTTTSGTATSIPTPGVVASAMPTLRSGVVASSTPTLESGAVASTTSTPGSGAVDSNTLTPGPEVVASATPIPGSGTVASTTLTPGSGGDASTTLTPGSRSVASSTPTRESELEASSTPTLNPGVTASATRTPGSGLVVSSTPTQSPMTVASVTPTETSQEAASPTSTVQIAPSTSTPSAMATATVTSTPPPTATANNQMMPNARFGFNIGSISDDAAIVNAMAQTGAGSWMRYDDVRATGPGGRVYLIRTGANRQPASFDSVIDGVARGRPGAYWLIGNEPNVPGQDFDGRYLTNGNRDYASLRASATRYAEALRHYRTLIQSADPTARIVFGNFLNFDATCEACGGFFSTREYLNEVQLAFQREWGEEIPADLSWGIHIYLIDWLHLPMIDSIMVPREIALLRAYIDTVASRRGAPIWLTEFGVIWGYPNRCEVDQLMANCPDSPFAEQAADTYLSATLDWLGNNAQLMGIDRWFFFANYALPEPFASVYGGMSLLDGSGPAAQLTRFGRTFLEFAQRAG